jgi:hypothetical protein
LVWGLGRLGLVELDGSDIDDTANNCLFVAILQKLFKKLVC